MLPPMQRSPSGRGIGYLDATPAVSRPTNPPMPRPPPTKNPCHHETCTPQPPTVTKKDHCDIYELCLIIIAFKNNQQLKNKKA